MNVTKCRVCLHMKPTEICASLFYKHNDTTMAELIMTCTSVQIVENDGYPDHICGSCYQRLQNTIDFINEVYASDRTLREVVSCKEEKVKVDELELADVKSEEVDVKVENTFKYESDDDDDDEMERKRMRLYEKLARNRRTFTCKYCNYESRDARDYAIHTKDNHLHELPVITTPVDKKPRKSSNPRYCLICDEKYVNATAVIEHVNERHFEKFGSTRKIPCSLCELNFFTYSSLIYHMRKFHQKYTKGFKRQNTELKHYLCSYCGCNFKTPQQLKLHVMAHEGNQPFKCDQCIKSFTMACHLEQHKLVNHSDEKPYVCDQCPKKFAVWILLRKHIQRTHEAKRKFSCEICGYKAKSRSLLENHQRTHGPKGFQCTNCPAAFKSKKCLAKHLRTHFPYVCSSCLKSFDSDEILQRHVEKCRHEQQRKIPRC